MISLDSNMLLNYNYYNIKRSTGDKKMQLTEKDIQDAKRVKQYFPYRRVWIAKKQELTEVICKPTAHMLNKMVRDGWTAWEIK